LIEDILADGRRFPSSILDIVWQSGEFNGLLRRRPPFPRQMGFRMTFPSRLEQELPVVIGSNPNAIIASRNSEDGEKE